MHAGEYCKHHVFLRGFLQFVEMSEQFVVAVSIARSPPSRTVEARLGGGGVAPAADLASAQAPFGALLRPRTSTTKRTQTSQVTSTALTPQSSSRVTSTQRRTVHAARRAQAEAKAPAHAGVLAGEVHRPHTGTVRADNYVV